MLSVKKSEKEKLFKSYNLKLLRIERKHLVWEEFGDINKHQGNTNDGQQDSNDGNEDNSFASGRSVTEKRWYMKKAKINKWKSKIRRNVFWHLL